MSKGSKYKSKNKGGKPVAPKRKLATPVYTYECLCHGVQAKKKPCVIDDATEFSDRNKAEHSLGTWNCQVTRKACKVSRTKYKVEEPVIEEIAA